MFSSRLRLIPPPQPLCDLKVQGRRRLQQVHFRSGSRPRAHILFGACALHNNSAFIPCKSRPGTNRYRLMLGQPVQFSSPVFWLHPAGL